MEISKSITSLKELLRVLQILGVAAVEVEKRCFTLAVRMP